MAAVYSDQGYGVCGPVVFYNRANEAAAQLKPGDFDWRAIFGNGVRWFPAAAYSPHCPRARRNSSSKR
jgi:2-dehydro-3-deoxygluconokinase